MTLVTEIDLPLVDSFDPAVAERYADILDELRDSGRWIVRTRMGVAVIEHEAVRELLTDRRLRPPGVRMFEMQGIHGGRMFERFKRSMISLEGEEHARLRRLVSRAFTPRAVDRLRPMMRAWIDERALAIGARGAGDVVADLTQAYPIAVICELVGAPEPDWPKFSAWAADVFRVFRMNLAVDLPVIDAADLAMRGYVVELIEQRRDGEPRDDLLSELLRLEEQGDRLSYEELCDLVVSLILAGTDTTRHQLGLVVLQLARHPDQWERLVADPSLVPQAVEEAVRLAPTARGTTRLAVEDLTYRGVTIPAGTHVALETAAANRDPAQVRCPHQFDVGAARGSWTLLTFGGGPHYCLGANLALAELQEALGVLVRRWRRFELDGEPEMRPFAGLQGPARLPVRVEAR
jgi:cytochrome P450